MAKTIKAERATILLGDIPINVYQMPDGSYKLAGRNVTDAIEEAANTLTRYYSVKSLRDLPGAEPIKSISGETLNAVTLLDAVKYWGVMATRGNELAQRLLTSLKEDPGIMGLTAADVPVFIGNKRKKQLNSESVIQSRLIEKHGGESEVMCLAGRIDVLTSTELIEVKEVKAWKGAIGQVIIYGCYYPSHSKRIHLFGPAHTSTKTLIESHCHKLNISVTWE